MPRCPHPGHRPPTPPAARPVSRAEPLMWWSGATRAVGCVCHSLFTYKTQPHRVQIGTRVESPRCLAPRLNTTCKLITHPITANIGTSTPALLGDSVAAGAAFAAATTLAPWPPPLSHSHLPPPSPCRHIHRRCRHPRGRHLHLRSTTVQHTSHHSMGLDDHAPCLQHTERVQATNS